MYSRWLETSLYSFLLAQICVVNSDWSTETMNCVDPFWESRFSGSQFYTKQDDAMLLEQHDRGSVGESLA